MIHNNIRMCCIFDVRMRYIAIGIQYVYIFNSITPICIFISYLLNYTMHIVLLYTDYII
jgi:hypothetical protein